MKEGLYYFPFPTALSDGLELVHAEYGHIAISIYATLLQKIYGGNGYYCKWNPEAAMLFTRRYFYSENVSDIFECVSSMIRRGIFDREKFEKHGILTSGEIQESYFEAVKRRKDVKICREYLLVDCALLPKNAGIFDENVDISSKNADILRQRKGKERKEKESKGEGRKKERGENAAPIPPAPAENTTEKRETETPCYYGVKKNVLLTKSQYERLCGIIPNADAYIDRFSEKLQGYSYRETNHFRILQEWWDKDKNKASNTGYGVSEKHGSFDTDEFFEAALRKTQRRIEEKYGEKSASG